MKSIHVLLIIATVLLLAGMQAYAGADADKAMLDCQFPSPQDGIDVYGYQYKTQSNVWEHPTREWYKIIDKGNLTAYYDSNNDGIQQPEEWKTKSYYVARIATISFGMSGSISDVPEVDGLSKNARECLANIGKERSRGKDVKSIGVGNGAIVGPILREDDYGRMLDKGAFCAVARGPFIIQTTISTYLVANGSMINIDQPGNKIQGDWCKEKDSINSRIPGWAATRNDEAVDLARKVLSKFDGCYSLPAAAKPKTDQKYSISLKADPAGVWVGSKTKVKLTLIAKYPAGKPLTGASFDINIENNLLGECDQVKFITGANGTDTAEYFAKKVGRSNITAKGSSGSASVTIGQGGIVITPDKPDKLKVMADGKTGVGMTVTCTDPSGKPKIGLNIALDMSSKDTKKPGTIDKKSVVTGSDGKAKFIFTAPVIDAASGTRATDVYANASASVGNPAQIVKATERISLYAGECMFLTVEKLGFTKFEKYAVSVQGRNGTINGLISTKSDNNTDLPVNCAKVNVTDRLGKELANGITSTDGKFSIKFVGDPTNPAESAVQLPNSVEIKINSDLTNRILECRKDIAELTGRKYDLASTAGFMDSFAENLAKSVPPTANQLSTNSDQSQQPPAEKKRNKGLLGALDKLTDGLDKLQKKLDKSQNDQLSKLSSTEYLINACPRLAWACRYAGLLDERQCESSDWLSENIKAGLGDAMDVFGITDKIHDTAKKKLNDKFAGTDWEKYTDNVLTDFMNIMYDQFQKGIDMAKTMNYDTGDIESYKKFGLEWTSKKTVDGITAGVKLTMQQISHKNTQEMLTKAGGAASRGELSSTDYKPDSQKALDLFTTFEKQHNKLNISNCNTEHYRLWTKLFIDTFVKGPMIYFNMKKVVMNPEMLEKIADIDTKSLEEIQDKFIKNGDLASKMGSAIDSMFQGYQGYSWIADYCSASTTREELKKLLIK